MENSLIQMISDVAVLAYPILILIGIGVLMRSGNRQRAGRPTFARNEFEQNWGRGMQPLILAAFFCVWVASAILFWPIGALLGWLPGLAASFGLFFLSYFASSLLWGLGQSVRAIFKAISDRRTG
jgi:hypothetical protein